jgi:type II secretory pathway component PulJ
MANQRPNNDKDEQDGIPWVLLICLLAMVLVLAIALPLVGLAIMDANNATNAAIVEIDRMRRIRNLMLRDLEDKNANFEPTQTTPTEESVR